MKHHLQEGLKNVPMTLAFHHLYDDRWAAFHGEARPHQLRRIIFPDFVPEEGVKYDVEVSVTMMGEFVYEGERFHTCHAQIADAGTAGDVLMYRWDSKNGTTTSSTAFGAKLAAALGREA